MSERKPIRDDYDGALVLMPFHGPARAVAGIVKKTFSLGARGLERAAPTPMRHDVREGKRWPPGSDFWPLKASSDVVVEGHAYAAGGRPFRERRVVLEVGRTRKEGVAFGKRVGRWLPNGAVVFEDVEAVERVRLDPELAYGGVDHRVPVPPASTVAEHLDAAFDHPGAYPRNRFGMGYRAVPNQGEADLVDLPQLEDPADRLTPERLLVRALTEWYRQPLPWFLGWAMAYDFPRLWFIGGQVKAGVPPEDVTLPEVARGLLSSDWRSDRCGDFLDERVPLRFFQEASPGMFHSDLGAGTPIVLEGAHPEQGRLAFTVPTAPEIEIELGGYGSERCPARVLHIVIRPDDLAVDVTWVALREGLPRAFVPLVHGDIPLSMRVDRDRPVPIEVPETTRAAVQRTLTERGLTAEVDLTRVPLLATLPQLLESARSPRRERDLVPLSERTMIADIDVATGSIVFREVDFQLPDGQGLEISRHFSSSMIWRDGLFGAGWSSPLEQALWMQSGWLLRRTAGGREVGLPLPRGELGLGASVHHPVLGYTVRRTASDAYELRLVDGRRSGFVSAPGRGAEWVARLAWTTTTEGQAVQVEWDTEGNLAGLRLPSGRSLRFEVTAGRMRRIFAPTAQGDDNVLVACFEYGADGHLIEAADGVGRRSRYQFVAGRLAQRTTRHRETVRYEYDGTGPAAACRSRTSGDPPRRWELARAGESTRAITLPSGNSYTVDVDAHHRIVHVRPLGAAEVVRTYDAHTGTLHAQASPDETQYLHDASFHLADVSAPDAGSVALEHDEVGHLTAWRDADGHTARWGWDELGRLRAHVDRAGASSVFEYDAAGPLSSMHLPGEARVVLALDPSASLVAHVDAPGGSRHARRDALGRVTLVADELGLSTHIRYAADGRVAQVAHPGELVRTYETDADGRVTSVHDGLCELCLERDARGLVTGVRRGGAGLGLHRDAEGRVTMVESESFDFWELRRDAAGRVAAESAFTEDDNFTYIRDQGGRVQRSSHGQLRTTVKRDRAGRPLELEHSDESFQRYGWTPGGRLARAQNADRLIELKHDGLGRVDLEQRGDGHWLKSDYGLLGRDVLQSSLGLAVRYERDAFGRATRLTATRGETQLDLVIERDAAGREARRTLPGGLALAWSRDGLGRPTERRLMLGDRTLATLRFGWAGFDRLISVEDPERGVRHHRYDARGRLIQAGGSVRVLDDAGRVFRSEACNDHTYALGGRLMETYGIEYRYDSAGRRTEKKTPDGTVIHYRWDAMDRLVEVELREGRRVTYDYDGLGRMTTRRLENETVIEGLDEPVWEAESATHFYWDGLELLHEATDGAVTTWLWEAGALVGKLEAAGAYAALLDSTGIPTDLTDSAGDFVWRGSVDLYGMFQRENAHTACPWRFPGHWEDPDTGLAHAWLRVWDPEIGSYLSPNPLGIAAGSNLYGYVDDPLTQTSPLGLGNGYAAVAGAMRSERLAAELIERFVDALDRRDGAAGPRQRFDTRAAQPRLPDPEAMLFGPCERFRPSRNLPPPTSTFTRLPESCGLETGT